MTVHGQLLSARDTNESCGLLAGDLLSLNSTNTTFRKENKGAVSEHHL